VRYGVLLFRILSRHCRRLAAIISEIANSAYSGGAVRHVCLPTYIGGRLIIAPDRRRDTS